jgi:hypothetical protein
MLDAPRRASLGRCKEIPDKMGQGRRDAEMLMAANEPMLRLDLNNS